MNRHLERWCKVTFVLVTLWFLFAVHTQPVDATSISEDIKETVGGAANTILRSTSSLATNYLKQVKDLTAYPKYGELHNACRKYGKACPVEFEKWLHNQGQQNSAGTGDIEATPAYREDHPQQYPYYRHLSTPCRKYGKGCPAEFKQWIATGIVEGHHQADGEKTKEEKKKSEGSLPTEEQLPATDNTAGPTSGIEQAKEEGPPAAQPAETMAMKIEHQKKLNAQLQEEVKLQRAANERQCRKSTAELEEEEQLEHLADLLDRVWFVAVRALGALIAFFLLVWVSGPEGVVEEHAMMLDEVVGKLSGRAESSGPTTTTSSTAENERDVNAAIDEEMIPLNSSGNSDVFGGQKDSRSHWKGNMFASSPLTPPVMGRGRRPSDTGSDVVPPSPGGSTNPPTSRRGSLTPHTQLLRKSSMRSEPDALSSSDRDAAFQLTAATPPAGDSNERAAQQPDEQLHDEATLAPALNPLTVAHFHAYVTAHKSKHFVLQLHRLRFTVAFVVAVYIVWRICEFPFVLAESGSVVFWAFSFILPKELLYAAPMVALAVLAVPVALAVGGQLTSSANMLCGGGGGDNTLASRDVELGRLALKLDRSLRAPLKYTDFMDSSVET